MRLHFRYVGNYYNHECRIELKDVRLDDGGIWKCEVEEWSNNHGRGWGDQVAQDMIVEVLRKTTTTTTTTETAQESEPILPSTSKSSKAEK